MSAAERVVQARAHRWGEGKVHLVDPDRPRSPLGEHRLKCGRWATTSPKPGRLADVTCQRCAP